MPVALPCIAQFVIVLDVTIVAIALPAMQADLGLSTTALGWVLTGYTLVFGGCLLAAGRVADRIGRRRAFVAGLVLFAAASLACGLAPTGAALLAARAVQGLGAALVSPAALALVTAARPRRPGARARAGLVDGRGRGRRRRRLGAGRRAHRPARLALGLPRQRADLPRRRAARPAGAARVARPRRARRRRRPAPRSSRSGSRRSCSPSRSPASSGPLAVATLAALGTAVLALLALRRVEARAAAPLLDRALLRRPGVATPNLVALALTATTSPPMWLCTLHAQQVLGLSPAAAGLLFPPFNAAVIAGSLLGPRVVAATGARARWPAGWPRSRPARSPCSRSRPGPRRCPRWPAASCCSAPASASPRWRRRCAGPRRSTAPTRASRRACSPRAPSSAPRSGLAIVVPIAAARTEALGGGPDASVAGYELGFLLAAALAAGTAVTVVAARLRAPRSEPRRVGVDSPSCAE